MPSIVDTGGGNSLQGIARGWRLCGVTFAAELREWRTRRRVSQLELALRAGTTQRHV